MSGKNKRPTNADRIRAMSDDELLHFLQPFSTCRICANNTRRCMTRVVVFTSANAPRGINCKDGLREWLSMPAEEVKK